MQVNDNRGIAKAHTHDRDTHTYTHTHALSHAKHSCELSRFGNNLSPLF